MEERARIIEKSIEQGLDIETTKQFLYLLDKTDNHKVFETRIGVFADLTGEYKTILQRCNELGIKSIGDLVRYGGKAFRESPNVGVKTAALVSDTLYEHFGIDNWFSKVREE